MANYLGLDTTLGETLAIHIQDEPAVVSILQKGCHHPLRGMLAEGVVHTAMERNLKARAIGDVTDFLAGRESADPADVGLEDIHQPLGGGFTEAEVAVPALPGGE